MTKTVASEVAGGVPGTNGPDPFSHACAGPEIIANAKATQSQRIMAFPNRPSG